VQGYRHPCRCPLQQWEQRLYHRLEGGCGTVEHEESEVEAGEVADDGPVNVLVENTADEEDRQRRDHGAPVRDSFNILEKDFVEEITEEHIPPS